MISLEKRNILTFLQKLPINMGELGKIIITTGFEKLPKVQKSPNLVALFMCNMHGGQYLGLSNMSNKVNLKICPKIEKVVSQENARFGDPFSKIVILGLSKVAQRV